MECSDPSVCVGEQFHGFHLIRFMDENYRNDQRLSAGYIYLTPITFQIIPSMDKGNALALFIINFTK
jgi:hypothetical protein